MVDKVRAMQLHVPSGVGEGEDPLFEEEETLDFLATKLREPLEKSVWGVITVPEDQVNDDEVIKKLVEAIHRDYDGTVLRENVPPKKLSPAGPLGGPHKNKTRVPSKETTANPPGRRKKRGPHTVGQRLDEGWKGGKRTWGMVKPRVRGSQKGW